ncbi:MAG: FKBP-type peptidyl-prolyl cis-trans isomerase [Muribaculaceae bacterium]|nr:FKBP-type peptidyl-prolyl cis-trans isomerase [Muribaculaceae bacterium]
MKTLRTAASALLAATAITAAATTAPADSVEVAPPPYTQAQADSCVTAFATVLASYCLPEIHRQQPDNPRANSDFARGVAEAFNINDGNSAYYMGIRTGLGMIDRVTSMHQMGYPITQADFVAAFSRALDGDTKGFTAQTADDYLRHFMNILNPPPKPLTDESQQAFLNAQSSREGVEQFPSGLLFEVITEGEGSIPGIDDKVKLTYTGRLADGTVFDQTERPVTFPLKGLVPGFVEGLTHMRPGGTYRIFIPAALGYGDRGASGVIPPNAALDLTVTLLDIEPRTNP